jgi:hypothetical protein
MESFSPHPRQSDVGVRTPLSKRIGESSSHRRRRYIHRTAAWGRDSEAKGLRKLLIASMKGNRNVVKCSPLCLSRTRRTPIQPLAMISGSKTRKCANQLFELQPQLAAESSDGLGKRECSRGGKEVEFALWRVQVARHKHRTQVGRFVNPQMTTYKQPYDGSRDGSQERNVT